MNPWLKKYKPEIDRCILKYKVDVSLKSAVFRLAPYFVLRLSVADFVKHVGSIDVVGLDLIRDKCSEVFIEYSRFIDSDLVDDCIVLMYLMDIKSEVVVPFYLEPDEKLKAYNNLKSVVESFKEDKKQDLASIRFWYKKGSKREAEVLDDKTSLFLLDIIDVYYKGFDAEKEGQWKEEYRSKGKIDIATQVKYDFTLMFYEYLYKIRSVSVKKGEIQLFIGKLFYCYGVVDRKTAYLTDPDSLRRLISEWIQKGES